jgi:hypothetical protein
VRAHAAAKLAGVISPTGHVAPVTLRWSGITCTLHSKKKGSKKLLSNMSGVARPGRLLAVMVGVGHVDAHPPASKAAVA